jgi:hypothetical protein
VLSEALPAELPVSAVPIPKDSAAPVPKDNEVLSAALTPANEKAPAEEAENDTE